jgi:hypothetical protein
MSGRLQRLAGATLVLLLAAACDRGQARGPVRSPMQAVERAQHELRAAGLDEEVIDARREGDAWVVVTRWHETSMAGHLVTVDATTGAATIERYRSIELGRPRPRPMEQAAP